MRPAWGKPVALLFALAVSASAQAWLYPKGEGTVTLAYQGIYTRDHAFEAERHDVGHIVSHALIMDVDYSITSRIAARMSLHDSAGKYTGPRPHPAVVDDGRYHSTFQDFLFDIRYNLSQTPVVVTPFFRIVVPSHSYEYFAHAAVGRDL